MKQFGAGEASSPAVIEKEDDAGAENTDHLPFQWGLKVIRQYNWSLSLAWEPGYGLRFTQPHMGAPYMGEDDLINALYALVLQGPRRNLHITGRTGSNQ